MIINGKRLLSAAPLDPMFDCKIRKHGVSHGLSEAGYDIRIKQSVTLHPLRRFSLASAIDRFDMPDDLIGLLLQYWRGRDDPTSLHSRALQRQVARSDAAPRQ